MLQRHQIIHPFDLLDEEMKKDANFFKMKEIWDTNEKFMIMSGVMN